MNSTPQNHEYRFERKFVTLGTGMHAADVESLVRLHPAIFREIYHRRWVNNIYLDSWTMDSYMDNVIGVSQGRVKVRIRWYGDLWGHVSKPVLELKIRHNLVNRKEAYPLEGFVMDTGLSTGSIQAMIRNAEIPPALRHDLLKLGPTLVNRYSRRYFLTADRAFRITIDSNLAFHACDTIHRRAVDDRWCEKHHVILELKYAPDAAHSAHCIVQGLPLRLSRSSKYVDGIEATRYRFGFANSPPRIGSRVDA